ncbi:MAG TPA: hypothetical protein PKE66_05900 [Pyrinomonadaceae bacterium]|nr:hypothetical protein [Pyrinomonadaceae bacterium]
MKNKFALVTAGGFLLLMVLGCMCGSNPFSGSQAPERGTSTNQGSQGDKDKTLTDKAVDVAVGEQTTGIPECDAVISFIEAEANNPDDDVFTKAIKATVLNRIKEEFRKNIEQNQADKEQMTRNCQEMMRNLEKFKAEQQNKEPQQQ